MNTPHFPQLQKTLKTSGGLSCVLLALQACGDPLGKDAIAQLDNATERGTATHQEEEQLGAGPPGLSREIEWGAETPLYLDLSAEQATEESETSWDLMFQGDEIFTNSGPSGNGEGGAFGPLDAAEYETDQAPQVPFLRGDSAGSALTGWYVYDSSSHTLWSKHHVYGIQSGTEYFKLQILSYYSEVQGAPVSAFVKVRYAPLKQHGSGETVELVVDATAGAPDTGDDMPSGCLALSSGEVLMLTAAEAAQRSDWDICLRRDEVTTNGGVGGPGRVRAVDLDGGEELSLEELSARSTSDWEARFDDVDYETVSGAGPYVKDGPRSGFTAKWLAEDSENELAEGSWLVRGNDGASRFMVLLADLERQDELRRLTVFSRRLTSRSE